MPASRVARIGFLLCAVALAEGLAVHELPGKPGSPPGPETGTPSPRVREGGVLRLLSELPASFDPPDVESVYDSLPINQIFDGLVRLDPGLNVMPALAETWTISRDGLSYTFRLREGVRFHDGSPLTAQDVVFTFRRALEPRREKRSIVLTYMGAVDGAAEFSSGRRADLPGVRALDARTVAIRLRRPNPSFLEVLALDYLRVVPMATVKKLGDAVFRKAPVGTGPFRFVSRDDAKLVLRANRDYFLGAPHLDEVQVFFPLPREVDRGERRFLDGRLDAIEPGAESLARLSTREDVAIHRFQELSVSFLGLATGHPDFEDVRVRQAVAHAIDRDAIVAFAPATRRVANGILPPGLPGYSPDVKTLPHDPGRARALLAEAGHADGRGLKPFTIFVSPGSVAARRTFEKIESDLRAVGFPCEVREVGWPELSRRLEDHDAPAFVLGWIADLADPDAFLGTLFVPEGTANYFDFSDEETARLLESGAYETNPVDRARAYRAIERGVLAKAPFVPLYHSVGVVARRAAVHGLEPGPLGLAALDLEDVWIEEGRP